MARINIEDKLWKDRRFQNLLIKLGDRQKAKGCIVELWTLAQENWFPNRNLIPLKDFHDSELQPAADVGLAEVRQDGVFAVGSEKAFEWLFERQDSGRKGGIASAKAKSSKAQAMLSIAQPDSSSEQQTQASSSSSSSLSSSSSDSSSLSNTQEGVKNLKVELGAAALEWKKTQASLVKPAKTWWIS